MATAQTIRPLTQRLTESEMGAVNDVLAAHGLKPHTRRPDLLSVLNSLGPVSTDTFCDVTAELRAALEGGG